MAVHAVNQAMTKMLETLLKVYYMQTEVGIRTITP